MSYITYKQADSRWGRKNYNGSSTMATAGCGPTSVAMLAYNIDGKTTPWTVAQYMQKHGYAIRNNGTAWAGIPAAMKNFGLTNVKNVPKMADVWSYLSKGYCAVFLMSAGSRGGITWTTAGHYIAVTDYKTSNGKHYVYTRDSGGRNHTGWYCYEAQMKGLIPQIWVGKATPKTRAKDQYKSELPGVTIKKGSKGFDVKLLQIFLNWALDGAFATLYIDKLKVDGDCGANTVKAIKLFQNVHHLTVDGIFGAASRKKADSMHLTKALKAVNWAVAISLDNDFAYGTGSRAHHNGCYFCGTNITGPKKATKGDKWNKTYCCNPFVHAAFAHGAGDSAMLKACKAVKSAGLVASDWTKFTFTNVGACSKIGFSALKVGDVILKKDKHVYIYTGGDYMVEASGESFDAYSIAHKTGAKKRYAEYAKSTAYVLRYKG